MFRLRQTAFDLWQSKIEEIAKKYGIEKVVKLPIDPIVADACDKGEVELVASSGMDELFDFILNKFEVDVKKTQKFELCGIFSAIVRNANG